MKIGGKKVDSAPASDFLVFPRKAGDIAIRSNAVMDRTEFDRLVPLPKPPKKMVKGGARIDDTEAPSYQTALQQHSQKFVNWLVIESLCGVNKETQEDEPIEWEKVNRDDPNTWALWEDELRETGFCDMERKRIHGLVMKVNSLNDDRLDEARNSFLQPPVPASDESSSQDIEPNDTQSGEPASASASDLPASPQAGTKSQK